MSRKRVHKLQIVKYSPFRPVAWRYERIMELVHAADGKQRCPVKDVDDDWITKGHAFIKRWNRICQNVDPKDQNDYLAEIFTINPALYFAYQIFLQPDDDYCKAAMEARILARQSNEIIAKSLSVYSPDTIEWYEQLFFNVRDRIDSVDYISKQVIGPLVGTGLHNVGVQLSAKFFGYFGGETMLEFMLHGVDRSIAVPRPGQSVNDYADAFFNAMVRSRAIVSAQSAEIDVYKVMPLLELHAKLIEEHNRAQLNSGPKNQLEETVGVLLAAVPWAVGNNRQQLLAQSPIGNYIGAAAEPRANDLLKLATGEEVPHLADLKDRRLPPPKIVRDPDENIKQGSRGSDS